jgi:hypothetical protein
MILAISGRRLNRHGQTVGTSRCGKDTYARAVSLVNEWPIVGLADPMTR